jgi:hypothetical protein
MDEQIAYCVDLGPAIELKPRQVEDVAAVVVE